MMELWLDENHVDYAAMGLLFYVLAGGLDEEIQD